MKPRPELSDDDFENVYENEEMNSDNDNEELSDEDISSVSFGALSKAQNQLARDHRDKNKNDSNQNYVDDNSDSDDSPPEEETATGNKKKSKHAPSEGSAKRPVSRIRNVPGLENKKANSLYKDIRFDPAYGKSDLTTARKNYSFLNDYRQDEVNQMKEDLKKTTDSNERQKLQTAIQSMQSRLETFKNKDFEQKVLSEYKKTHKNHHLKRSDKRKLLLTEKYKNMKKKDVNKAIEKKRKKNVAKERKSMPLERRS